jgi:large subunit ribosomal protein L22
MITASLKNYRIAPRKFRVVADMIRGKNVTQAKLILAHAAKKGKSPLSDLLDSAIANAKNNFQLDGENLLVKEIRVDQGLVMKRIMPVSRGMAHGIKKRTSHVSIVLAPTDMKISKEAKSKEAIKADDTKITNKKPKAMIKSNPSI